MGCKTVMEVIDDENWSSFCDDRVNKAPTLNTNARRGPGVCVLRVAWWGA